MATFTVNGSSYPFPEINEEDWGTKVNNWASAVSSAALWKSGGAFTLTAEIDFGTTYGLKSAYFKSRATNPASTGQMRLGNTEKISWRNAANNTDKDLSVDAYDRLTYAGAVIAESTGTIPATSIGGGTVSDTEFSYLNGVTSALQTQIDGKQPLDSDLTAVAGLSSTGLVARTGSGTASARTISAGSSKVSISNGDGVSGNPSIDVTEANLTHDNIGGTLGIAKGGTGQTSKTAAFDALAPTTTKGDIIASDGSDNIRLAAGTDGQVLTSDSTQTSGLKWTSPLTNPMDSAGDMIIGGASGAASKLDAGTDGQLLVMTSGSPAWGNIYKGQVSGSSISSPYVGQVITGSQDRATGGALSNNGQVDVCNLTLTPGVWLVFGVVGVATGAATLTKLTGWINTTSSTTPASSQYGVSSSTGQIILDQLYDGTATSNDANVTLPPVYINTSSASLPIYLGIRATFGAGTVSRYGSLTAVRVA